jgi:hypothetical protein
MRRQRPTVIEQLRIAIRRCGKTEYCVAKGAEIDNGVLSRFMRGKRGISLGTASKLCAYLRLRLSAED